VLRSMRRCSAAVCVGFTLALFLAFVIFILVPETERGKDHDDGYFYDLDNDKQIVCLVLVIITSSLSIMGSCLIFISYLGLRSRGDTLSNATFDKTSNAAPTEVVLLLSVSLADFISAFTKLTTSSSSVHDRDWLIQKTKFCAVMGFAEQFGTLATALWTLCIAIYLYRIIILKRGSEGWLLGFQMLAWGLPFLTATIATSGQLCLKFVFANIVEVKLVENDATMKMHPVVTLLAVTFFGLVWGPTGMLLCVPMMTYLKVALLSDVVPSAYRNPMLVLLEGDRHAPERHLRRSRSAERHARSLD